MKMVQYIVFIFYNRKFAYGWMDLDGILNKEKYKKNTVLQIGHELR